MITLRTQKQADAFLSIQASKINWAIAALIRGTETGRRADAIKQAKALLLVVQSDDEAFRSQLVRQFPTDEMAADHLAVSAAG